MTKLSAALLGIVCGIAASVGVLLAHEMVSGQSFFISMPGFLPFVILVVAGQVVLIGAPLLLLLHRFHLLNLVGSILVGIVAAAMPWLLVSMGSKGGLNNDALDALFRFAAYGAVGGATFYLVFRMLPARADLAAQN